MKTRKIYYKNLHKTEQYGKSTTDILNRWKKLYEGYVCIPHPVLEIIYNRELFTEYDTIIFLYIWGQTIGKGRTMFQQDFDIDDILEKMKLGKSSIPSIKKSILKLDELNMISLKKEIKITNFDRQGKHCIRNKKTKITIHDDINDWKLPSQGEETEGEPQQVQPVKEPVVRVPPVKEEEEKVDFYNRKTGLSEEDSLLLKELEGL